MFFTKMGNAKRGIVTKEMEIVSKKEDMDFEVLMEHMKAGRMIIPANKMHKSLDPNGIGKDLKTKINVNIGIWMNDLRSFGTKCIIIL